VTVELASVTPPIPRDSYGRPLVTPPGGGRPVAYTRCTTYVGVLEDTYNLSRWQQRMVALGLAGRPDLLLAVTAHGDDRDELNRICADAQEAAAAHAAATTGTALHALTERIDRGQSVGVIPDAYRADLAAYKKTTAELTPVHIEAFTVLDELRVGGTPDRIVEYDGHRYIADVKTGSIEYGMGKIAMQLAVYSRSVLYDHTTGDRTPLDVDLSNAIVVHLPAGEGQCQLHWINIAAGWEAVQLATQVRAWRSRRNLSLPLDIPAQNHPPGPGPGQIAGPHRQTDPTVHTAGFPADLGRLIPTASLPRVLSAQVSGTPSDTESQGAEHD
jgi:PD-(D/E)XK nuclease superfamily